MAEHNEFGTAGEDMAVKWLKEKGYAILHRNWRYKQYEIDIIARKDKFLHIIEVKSRHYSPFGHPEDSVGKKKFKNLQRATDEYLQLNPGHKWIQYNILAITLFKDKDPEFFLLEDVFL
ncbi:MAG: YraN family protein [Chitinophagaceae bacterium]|nr:YraN family protein [Chitinophagaceae bacterium]